MVRCAVSILTSCLLVAACSKSKPAATVQISQAHVPVTVAAPVAATIDEEPPEQVLRELMFRQYAELEKRGGLPATVTANGFSGVVHAKLYEVHKDECHHLSADPPGVQECGVNLMVTMWWEGRPEPSEPLADSKRISVIRDNGVWIDCTYVMDRTSICSTGRKR